MGELTREQIVNLAREAGAYPAKSASAGTVSVFSDECLMRFANHIYKLGQQSRVSLNSEEGWSVIRWLDGNIVSGKCGSNVCRKLYRGSTWYGNLDGFSDDMESLILGLLNTKLASRPASDDGYAKGYADCMNAMKAEVSYYKELLAALQEQGSKDD